MAQELDLKILNLRADMTRLVHEGMDEDGTVLRRMLAELERLENFRSTLRNPIDGVGAYSITMQGDRSGGAHAGFAI